MTEKCQNKDVYSKAVDRFEFWVKRATSHKIASGIHPADLSRATVARDCSALEKMTYIKKTANGSYILGDAAWRVGLTAWGFPEFSPASLQLVNYLRVQTGRTSFLGVLHQQGLNVLSFSSARGQQFRTPLANYSITDLGVSKSIEGDLVDGRVLNLLGLGFAIGMLSHKPQKILLLGLCSPKMNSIVEQSRVEILADVIRKFQMSDRRLNDGENT